MLFLVMDFMFYFPLCLDVVFVIVTILYLFNKNITNKYENISSIFSFKPHFYHKILMLYKILYTFVKIHA